FFDLKIVAARSQSERDFMPDEARSRELFEHSGAGLEHHGVGEATTRPVGRAVSPSVPSIRYKPPQPVPATPPVVPATCTRSPTRRPCFPIRKKYPATERITFCKATAMPAVRKPAKVVMAPSSLAKAIAMMIATSDQTTNLRSARN